jgi:hypothetical protein
MSGGLYPSLIVDYQIKDYDVSLDPEWPNSKLRVILNFELWTLNFELKKVTYSAYWLVLRRLPYSQPSWHL